MADDQANGPAGDGTGGPASSRPHGSGAWGALLSAPEFAAIAEVGFEPVGQVLGTTVTHLGYVSQGGRCSASTSYIRTDLASAGSGPFNVLLRKRYGIRRRILSRVAEECSALGGDGILGLKLSIRPFPAGGTEFTLRGTAVRARTRNPFGADGRLDAPFTSHVSGQEFAALLRSGWVPAGLVFAIALGARHPDMRTRDQAFKFARSGEVRGYAELVKDTRRDARDQLRQAVADQGADGVVVDDMTLHIGERECPAVEGDHDYVAEATISGTSIVSFGQTPAAMDGAPLVIMRLNPPPPAVGEVRPAHSPELPAEPSPGEGPSSQPEPEAGRLERYLAVRAAKRASRSGYSSRDSAK